MDADIMMAGIDALKTRTHNKVAQFLVDDGQCKTIEEALIQVEKTSEEVYKDWKERQHIHTENPLS